MPATAAWLADASLATLLQLSPSLSRRERRLFGAACLRRAATWAPHPSLLDIVAACERHADAPADAPELGRARDLAFEFTPSGYHDRDESLWDLYDLQDAVNELLTDDPDPWFIAYSCRGSLGFCGRDCGEAMFQADLFRAIVGNPFRPVAFDPAWRTATVMALARCLDATQRYRDLPILADALEEAGCDAAELLRHLRDPFAAHTAQSWALRMVRGR